MIEVKNLVKCYSGTQKAVDGLNFTIEKGQIVGFLGPNGAGKSTTMNIITGYISATEGTVLIDGYDILKEPEKAKKNIGYLPELPPLYMDMTVKEYLVFAAKLKGVKRMDMEDTVSKAMAATKIEKMERRLIRNLSKGFKQRVGLAGTLLGDPEVLILDEPTVGLDPMQIIEIRDLITNLAKTHTVILSSHILQEISAVCNRVLIINNGRLVLDEMTSELDKNMEDSECLAVTVKTTKNKLNDLVKNIKSVKRVAVSNSDDSGCTDAKIYTKDNADIREEFFNIMSDNKMPVLKMVIDKMSLEDVFLEATKEENIIDTRKKKKNNKKKTLSSVLDDEKNKADELIEADIDNSEDTDKEEK